MSGSCRRLRLCLLGLVAPLFGAGSQPPEQADLSLPALTSPSALHLQRDGEAVAAALAHYTSALQFENSGKLREALDHYLAALEADPANPDLAMHTAELAYSFRGRELAIEILLKTVKASPEDPAPYLNLARFCATYAPDDPFENDRARQTLDTALKKFPKKAEVYGFAAVTYLTQGDRDAAMAVMDKALRLEVAVPDFWLTLGRAAQQVWPLAQAEMRDEHVKRVNAFYAKALKHAPGVKNEPVQLEVAQYYLLTNQLEEARDLCAKMVAQSGNLHARKLLYRLLDAFGEKDKALEQLVAVVEADPRDVEQQRMLASVYESREDFANAVKHLEAAIQIGGGEGDDYLYLGELLLRAQLYEKLVQLSHRSILLFPEQAMFYVQAALAERSLQHWDKAIQAFEKADKLAETGQGELINHRFYFQYAVTLERGGRPEDAGRIFEKSITLTPKDDVEAAANTMNYLGYMWLELERHLDKAGELINKANELQPDNAAFVDSLGWWHFKKGDYPNALKELQRAVTLLPGLQPDDAEIIEHIGQVYLKMNNKAKAREQFEKARDLQPTSPDVRKRIEDGLKKSAE
ncbi:Tfp pilus assembly protein PilF [Prosthecobacter fusiformis]|uniref:Tfp pilus assembly protein PilF n=1 Tax=Prosthecobacter fusiformis TaxID=48464 RepID=A0A4R7RNE5_9BACT|nr:tetratricopeptide repeat protein [Prosthecobacter fusiformis]TDU66539.1 Tfp pilus assembly protein PilF [Prosthecobacter fusiformis]